MSDDVFITPPLRIDVPALHVIATAAGCLILAQPLEIGADDLLRVGLTSIGRILGVWVHQAAPA